MTQNKLSRTWCIKPSFTPSAQSFKPSSCCSDNLMTDIYGANLYNRYLAQQQATMTTTTKLVAQGTGSQVTRAVPDEELVSTAAQCHSILVGREKKK